MSRNTKIWILIGLVVIGAFVVLRAILNVVFSNFWYLLIIAVGIYVGYKALKK